MNNPINEVEVAVPNTPDKKIWDYAAETDEVFFPVSSTPVMDDNGQPTGYQRIKRTDTDVTLAIPKLSYTLTPYEKRVDTIRSIVKNSGLDLDGMTETIKTSHEGKKLFVGINLPAEKEVVAYHPNGDDSVNLSINLWDSYDGSCSFMVKAGVYRYKCSNHLLVGETVSSMTKRHIGAQLSYEEILEGTMISIDAWKMERDNFQKWNETPISEKDAYESLLEFTNKKTIQDDLFTKFRKEAGYGSGSVWDFVNTLTSWATHTKKDSEDSKEKSNNYLNSSKTRQLQVLEFRNSEQFDKLVTVQ